MKTRKLFEVVVKIVSYRSQKKEERERAIEKYKIYLRGLKKIVKKNTHVHMNTHDNVGNVKMRRGWKLT